MYFFIIIGTLGSLVFGRMILLLIKQMSVSNWQYVEGEITKSNIEERPDHTTLLSKYNPAFGPSIFYSYAVGEKEYSSNRVCIITDLHYSSFICGIPGHYFSKMIVDRFPAGKKVPVYYNPKKHNYSIVIKKLSNYRFIFFGMLSGILILYSVVGLLLN